MSAEQVAAANERLAELHIPGARIAEAQGRPELRWRLYAHLNFSVDGTAENTVKTECLLATAFTAGEILEKAWEFSKDTKRQMDFVEFGKHRHLRGLPLDTEPLPETPEQKARTEASREKMKRGIENYREGMRAHLHNKLAMEGLLDAAKRYHAKTGRLGNLFGKVRQVFDLGR